jgi:hypothetical protein
VSNNSTTQRDVTSVQWLTGGPTLKQLLGFRTDRDPVLRRGEALDQDTRGDGAGDVSPIRAADPLDDLSRQRS